MARNGIRKRKIVSENTTNLSNQALADEMIEKQTKKSTKDAYATKVGIFVDWCKRHRPEALAEQDKVIIPMSTSLVTEFFGYLCIPARERSRVTSPEDVPPDADDPPSSSTLTTYRSALVDLYRQQKLKISDEWHTQVKSILDGYEKTINDLRRRGLMKINEGKRHLKFRGYELISKKFMTMSPTGERVGSNWGTSIFCWSFLTMLWNLMSRSESVSALLFEHLDWENDALIVEEQGHKGDQMGADRFGKHVYANSLQPWIERPLS